MRLPWLAVVAKVFEMPRISTRIHSKIAIKDSIAESAGLYDLRGRARLNPLALLAVAHRSLGSLRARYVGMLVAQLDDQQPVAQSVKAEHRPRDSVLCKTFHICAKDRGPSVIRGRLVRDYPRAWQHKPGCGLGRTCLTRRRVGKSVLANELIIVGCGGVHRRPAQFKTRACQRDSLYERTRAPSVRSTTPNGRMTHG
jgi:hypothetical protein